MVAYRGLNRYRGMGYGPQNGVGYGVRPSESGGVRGTVLYEEGGVNVHGRESEHAKRLHVILIKIFLRLLESRELN